VPVVSGHQAQRHAHADLFAPQTADPGVSPAPPRIVPEELPSRVAPALPTINVSIGRVEVRAVHDQAPIAPPVERRKSSIMNLEQYLERRTAGGRS
jgi:hypothetical protein